MNNLDYGVIGNCASAALISSSGTIEWCCLPEFDSASIFAKILDPEIGGEFAIETDNYQIDQSYLQGTNILCTRFTSDNNCFEVIDFMPRYKDVKGRYHTPPDLIRYIRHISGTPKARFRYDPRLGYAQYTTANRIHPDTYIKSFSENGTYESIYLYSSLPLEAILNQEEIVMNHDHYFLLSYNQKILDLNLDKIILEFERTKVYWLDWVNRGIHFKKYSKEIIRSSLVLKLLSYQKSGALLAAVTTSLPETIGEVRNWDYRFCWIRDASMILAILTNLGHYNVAERFLKFIVNVIPYKDEKIQIMYGIRGRKDLTERELPWLSGYEHSRPVRVGNSAYLQKQNDIYGVLLDVIYKYFNQFSTNIDNGEELWTIVRSLVRTVISTWSSPDTGIWEFRSTERHFVFSKVLCWVALDRGVEIAGMLGQNSTAAEWGKIRDAIADEIHQKGWNDALGAYTQYYGSTNMDAANLLMATYGFIEPLDPRYRSTVLKTLDDLSENGLMLRYKDTDDFGKPSSSFTVCTFWMIKSLYLIGEKQKARTMFENILQYSNHLGLYSEDMDFKSKRLLGNFPQGYSHLALIDAAIVLSEEKIEDDDKLKMVMYSQQLDSDSLIGHQTSG